MAYPVQPGADEYPYGVNAQGNPPVVAQSGGPQIYPPPHHQQQQPQQYAQQAYNFSPSMYPSGYGGNWSSFNPGVAQNHASGHPTPNGTLPAAPPSEHSRASASASSQRESGLNERLFAGMYGGNGSQGYRQPNGSAGHYNGTPVPPPENMKPMPSSNPPWGPPQLAPTVPSRASSIPPNGSFTPPQTTSSSSSSKIWIGVIIACVLVIGVIAFVWKSYQRNRQKTTRGRQKSSSSRRMRRKKEDEKATKDDQYEDTPKISRSGKQRDRSNKQDEEEERISDLSSSSGNTEIDGEKAQTNHLEELRDVVQLWRPPGKEAKEDEQRAIYQRWMSTPQRRREDVEYEVLGEFLNAYKAQAAARSNEHVAYGEAQTRHAHNPNQKLMLPEEEDDVDRIAKYPAETRSPSNKIHYPPAQPLPPRHSTRHGGLYPSQMKDEEHEEQLDGDSSLGGTYDGSSADAVERPGVEEQDEEENTENTDNDVPSYVIQPENVR